MSKAKFDAAKELIDQKKYGDARKILKTIEHPTARVWERKLDAMNEFEVPADLPKAKPKSGKGIYNSMRGCLVILVAFAIVWIVARPSGQRTPSNEVAADATQGSETILESSTTEAASVTIIPTVENRSGFVTITPAPGTVCPTATITDTPRPTVAPSMTMVPNATVTARPASLSKPPEVLISDAIKQVSDVNLLSVRVADGRVNGGERVAIIAYTTQTVDPEVLVGEMATIFGALAVALTQNDLDIDSASLIFGPSEDETAGIVAVQASDLINYGNGIITAEDLFRLITFTSMTDSTASSSSVRAAPVAPVSQGYPNNCDEAVAMGLTASQAGQYSHLDRDDDGVACYGD